MTTPLICFVLVGADGPGVGGRGRGGVLLFLVFRLGVPPDEDLGRH